jgi:hypothetical protein
LNCWLAVVATSLARNCVWVNSRKVTEWVCCSASTMPITANPTASVTIDTPTSPQVSGRRPVVEFEFGMNAVA